MGKATVTNQKLQTKALIIAAAALLSVAIFHKARADQLQDEINAQAAKVSSTQSQVNSLQSRADTLNNHLALLNAQIAANQAQLNLELDKQAEIKAEIAKANTDLAKKKAILQENIRLIYQYSQVTPLEMLFSSQSFGQFIDTQQYLERIKDTVQQAADQIVALKRQLSDENNQLVAAIAQAKALQFGLDQKQGQVNHLLAVTQGQESAYQSLLANQKNHLSALEAEQAALIAANSGGSTYGGTGGYPWAGEPKDGGVDDWGYYWRECTSYAAWKRAALGRALPPWGRMGTANARDWVDWARASGYRVDHTPEYGAVGVYTGGDFGHVMIVEAVVGSQVFVSQYNADFTGRYSESYWNISSLWFIH